ncbi:MAG: YihY/virulence factor BrkB family protein [Rhizobiaceae bacterium]
MAIQAYFLRHVTCLRNAGRSFGRDDGWAIASHVTLSGIMALFPFLIFCASLVPYFDLGDFPDTVVHLIFDVWPASVAGPVAQEIRTVLTQQRGDVLTSGAAVALLFASSGVEALRLGLNRAYRMAERRNMLILRLQSILFVVISSLIVITIAFLLVLLPLGWAIARKHLPWLDSYEETVGFWRLAVSVLVLIVALVTCHKWLPAGTRGLGEVLPGVIVTLVCWFAASLLFAAYLEQFATYVGTYAGLAGIMIALVFIYIMSVIFLVGAEYNKALTDMDAR